MSWLRSLVQRVREAPLIRGMRERRYRHAFYHGRDGWPRFYGLYLSRSEALAAAPPTRPVGYDHRAVVDVNLEAMSTIWTSDYPVIFWLSRIFQNSENRQIDKLLDLGGHVGTKYRAWAPYLPIPAHFRWVVCDLPAMEKAGREMNPDSTHLEFTTDYAAICGSEVLLASGVLQYIDREIEDLLGACATPPTHLLLNKVPTHKGADAFTLENLLESTVPYRIFDGARLVERLEAHGYAVADSWIVPESQVRVPYTDLGTPVHRGFYLRRADRS